MTSLMGRDCVPGGEAADDSVAGIRLQRPAGFPVEQDGQTPVSGHGGQVRGDGVGDAVGQVRAFGSGHSQAFGRKIPGEPCHVRIAEHAGPSAGECHEAAGDGIDAQLPPGLGSEVRREVDLGSAAQQAGQGLLSGNGRHAEPISYDAQIELFSA